MARSIRSLWKPIFPESSPKELIGDEETQIQKKGVVLVLVCAGA
jgi:hypothetical protein